LNALKALRGAPTSMGRGEIPVERQPAAVRFCRLLFIKSKSSGGRPLMTAKKNMRETPEIIPMLKTVEQMSRISGIGENKLRELMDQGDIEYVQNGNRRLLADSAIWDWYNRNKISALCQQKG
jgi:hypothetical protein